MDPIVQIGLISGGSALGSALIVGLANLGQTMIANRQHRRDREEDRADRLRIEDVAKRTEENSRGLMAAIAENTDLTKKTEIATNSIIAKAEKLALEKAADDATRAHAAGVVEGRASAQTDADDERNGTPEPR
jgi:hypothetical protein